MTSQKEDGEMATIPDDVPQRQCGRCRQRFDGDPTLDAPDAIPDWWLCPACHDVIFGP